MVMVMLVRDRARGCARFRRRADETYPSWNRFIANTFHETSNDVTRNSSPRSTSTSQLSHRGHQIDQADVISDCSAARPALHLGADALEFQLRVGHVLGVPDECPAERQRFRYHLTKSADPDPDDVDVAAVGMRFDHTGDRFAQRQLMHRWSPASRARRFLRRPMKTFLHPSQGYPGTLTGRIVNVDELYASIEANRPGRDDVVYLQRHGDEYDWWIVPAGRHDPARPHAPARSRRVDVILGGLAGRTGAVAPVLRGPARRIRVDGRRS